MLLGALGRDRRLAVFAPAVFHTLPLYLGFFNYLESIPAAIAVVALSERQLHDPTSRRAVAIGAGAAFLLWLHPSALAFACPRPPCSRSPPGALCGGSAACS